jgi:hypothetical protein
VSTSACISKRQTPAEGSRVFPHQWQLPPGLASRVLGRSIGEADGHNTVSTLSRISQDPRGIEVLGRSKHQATTPMSLGCHESDWLGFSSLRRPSQHLPAWIFPRHPQSSEVEARPRLLPPLSQSLFLMHHTTPNLQGRHDATWSAVCELAGKASRCIQKPSWLSSHPS